MRPQNLIENSFIPYSFNGMETDDEVKGEGNSYTTEYRQCDPRIGRWLTLDPVVHPNQSPYCSMDNNPILLNDPLGTKAGDYYTTDGKHIGSDGNNDDLGYTVNESDVVYKSDGKTIDKDKTAGATQFTDKHYEFTISSNVVKHESSGDKTESLWIAHTANNAKDNNAIDYQKDNTTLYDQLTDQGYSTTPASARTPLSNTDNSVNAKNARAAVINVLSGGVDPTGGAVLWDGQDFIEDGTASNKYSEYSKVSIGTEALKAYHDFWSGKTDVFHVFTMSRNLNKGSYISGGFNKVYNLYSKGAEGGSIFWGIMKNPDFEKGRKQPGPIPKNAAQCTPPVPACLKGSLWGQ